MLTKRSASQQEGVELGSLDKTLLLGLGGMGGGILDMSACLLLDGFLEGMLFADVLLNCADTHYLKV